MYKIIRHSITVHCGNHKTALRKSVCLLLRTREKMPFTGYGIVLVSILLQDRGRVIFGIYAYGHDLYIGLVPEYVIDPLHLPGHHRADAWTRSEKEIHYRDLSFHIVSTDLLALLIQEVKLGNVLMSCIRRRAFLVRTVYYSLVTNR